MVEQGACFLLLSYLQGIIQKKNTPYYAKLRPQWAQALNAMKNIVKS